MRQEVRFDHTHTATRDAPRVSTYDSINIIFAINWLSFNLIYQWSTIVFYLTLQLLYIKLLKSPPYIKSFQISERVTTQKNLVFI